MIVLRRASGISQLRQGTVATAQEFLLEVLRTRFRGIPNSLQQLIRTTEDVTMLRNVVKAATTAESIERFREELETAHSSREV